MADNIFDQIHSQAQAQPTPPPGAGNIFDQIHAQAQPKPEAPGFFESAWNAINPAPAVREWLNRPQAHRDMADALTVGMKVHNEKRQPTPAEQEIIDRGMRANVQHPEGNILAEMAGPGFSAAGQAKEGNLAGAAGTLVGGYAVRAALGAAAPALGEGAAKAGTFTGSAIRTAAPQVAGGAALMGAGEVIARGAQAVGFPEAAWTARAGMAYPGARMITAGLKKGVQAGKTALAERAAAIADQTAAADRAAAAAAPRRLPAAPDPSYVRSVPAEPPPNKGMLGPAPQSIVTPAPPAAPDASFVRAVPAEYPTQPPPQPRALLGPGAAAPIITPAPADASFVRSVPAEYPQVETPAPAANALPAAPAEDMATLDGLAQELNGTSFAKASPESQATIRTIASRVNQPIPAELNAPPPAAAPRTPYQAPEPAAPSKTLQQMIQDDLVARRATQPTERQPAPAATQAAQTPVQTEVNQESRPVLEQAGRSNYTATGELKSQQLRVQEKIGSARAKNATALAQAFHDSGISVEDATTIKLDDPVWKKLSDSLGQKRPSQETVEATLLELRRLEKSAKN